ncbi:response regulator transcription factor [Acidobacteriota bacterium]
MSIKILVVDDHQIVRESIRAFLDTCANIEVIGEAANGQTGIKLAKTMLPDIVIMDLIMPDVDGIEATRQIMKENGHTKIIGLSIHTDRRFVQEMLGAGALGYLLKDCAFEELDLAIKSVLDDKVYVSPSLNLPAGTGGARKTGS